MLRYTYIACLVFTSGHVRLCGTVTCQGSSSPSRQCSSTRVAFGLGFLSQQKCNNTGASPILSWTVCIWFLPVPSTEISTEGTALLWCSGNQEYAGRAEKASTKWLPGMFPTHLHLLAEVYICTRGLFWRKCSLHDCDKGKAVPLQARRGPEGSRKLRFPDFVTTAQDGGRLSALRTGRFLPPGNTPGTHFC